MDGEPTCTEASHSRGRLCHKASWSMAVSDALISESSSLPCASELNSSSCPPAHSSPRAASTPPATPHATHLHSQPPAGCVSFPFFPSHLGSGGTSQAALQQTPPAVPSSASGC